MQTPYYRHTLTFENREKYLYAFVSLDKADLPTVRQFWTEIAATCRARGYKKVLVEQRIAERLSVTDLYQLGTELPEIGKGLTGAIVDQRPDDFAHLTFGEAVAVNRGAWGRVFRTLAEAEAWLLSPLT
jgi:hypothetical protein